MKQRIIRSHSILIKAVLFFLAFGLFSLPASAQLAGGIYADPAKLGQGVNIIITDEHIYGVWYFYDENGQPLWATFLGEPSGNTLNTSLLRFQGPQLAAPWDGSQVQFVAMGTVEIIVLSPTSITFSYEVDGVAGVLNLEPAVLAVADVDSDEDGVSDDVDNCPEVFNPDQEDADGDGVGDACALQDTDNDGVVDGEDNCPEIANPDQMDSDEDGSGDLCDVCAFDADNDIDGDNFCGNVDLCPENSTETSTIIDGCDAGVDNIVLFNGCTLVDEITACAEAATNHGGFVSCVAHVTNEVKKDGLISGKEKGAIQSCAAQSAIP